MRPRRRKRPLRRHRSLWGIKIAAIVVTLLSITAAGRWIYRNSVVENSEFKLRDLVVRSDGALSPQTLIEVSGVEPGVNLLTLDLDEIRGSIESLSLVESATVERVFPADLEIRVKERRPIAWLACPPQGIEAGVPQGGHLLSDEGLVLSCDRSLPQFDRLPVIEVMEVPDEAHRLGPAARQMEIALELLEKSASKFDGSGLELLEIKLYPAYSLTCTYNQDLEVVFGLADIERQLQDLSWILNDAVNAGRRLATVNTMMSRNIPVTYHDAVLNQPAGTASPNLRPLDPAESSDSDRQAEPSRESDLRQLLRRG